MPGMARGEPLQIVPRLQLRVQAIQPWPAVSVAERRARRHLGDVRFGVELVGVQELPAEAFRERFPDRGLAGPGDAHHHYDHFLRVTAWPPNFARIIASSFRE